MEVTGKYCGALISPRKVMLVADQIRGCSLAEAGNILTYSTKKAAVIIQKLLNSVIANAEHNHAADIDTLKVMSIIVNKGFTLKRMRCRAKGRGDRILKRSSHILIKLSDKK